jgi:hypothetical protein
MFERNKSEEVARISLSKEGLTFEATEIMCKKIKDIIAVGGMVAGCGLIAMGVYDLVTGDAGGFLKISIGGGGLAAGSLNLSGILDDLGNAEGSF